MKVKIQTRLRVSENKAQLAGALSSESSLEQSSMLGDIIVRLYDETPIHCDNFLKLVNLRTFAPNLRINKEYGTE